MTNREVFWFSLCVAILIVVVPVLAFVSNTYASTDITVVAKNYQRLEIKGEAVTMGGGASNFFALKSLDNEIIIGIPAPKPLGWEGKEYYMAEPTKIQEGTWIIEKGPVTLRLTSPSTITVSATTPVSFKIKVLLILIATIIAIWAFVQFIVFRAFKD
ncbi:MAG: hypothetical protein ABIB98_03955 [bacterium]